MNIKTQTMSLLNRFLVIESDALLAFIQKSGLISFWSRLFPEYVLA